MRLGILGTGVVGKTIAAQLADLGHEVMVGTRDPEETMARTEPDRCGTPPFSSWQEEHPDVELLSDIHFLCSVPTSCANATICARPRFGGIAVLH